MDAGALRLLMFQTHYRQKLDLTDDALAAAESFYNGEQLAKLDPLGLEPEKNEEELDPRSYGFTEADMNRRIFLAAAAGASAAIAAPGISGGRHRLLAPLRASTASARSL